MGSRIFYAIKSQFGFVNKHILSDFSYDNMYRIVGFFWSFLCSYTFYLCRSFFRYFFIRFSKSLNLDEFWPSLNQISDQEHDEKTSSSCCMNCEIDRSDEGGENSVVMETALCSSTNRYEFSSCKGVFGYVAGPQTMSLTVHELSVLSNNDEIASNSVFDTGGSMKEEFYDAQLDAEQSEDEEEEEEETESLIRSCVIDEEQVFDNGVIGNQEFDAEKTENSDELSIKEDLFEKPEVKCFSSEENDYLDHNSVVDHDSSGEVQVLSTCQSSLFDVQKESATSVPEIFGRKNETDSSADEVPTNRPAGKVSKTESSVSLEEETAEHADASIRDQSADSDDEYIELQQFQEQNSSSLSREDSDSPVDKQEQSKPVQEKAEQKREGLETSDGSNNKDQNSSSDAEYMLEHEDIIEQLKMELKLARIGGLPTIIEESESEEVETPRTVEKLKPMKIDDKKFERKDILDGIQKVYKGYLDKMRKLDILNFQTMHALGLLQMKDTAQFQTVRKPSMLALTSLISQNLWLCKESAVVDPLKKVIADVNWDFETIYVGQLCISWEILHWQYYKTLELQNYDSEGSHQYNQVAGEFQLFQVLIQRFIENEQFQGPRVQNYVKSRCVLRRLLQVPLVKDDCTKDKGNEGEEAITSQMLGGVIKQSMRVFLDFLRGDKVETSVIHQGNLHTHLNLQDPVDLELLTDVRTEFQKKDRRLKDLVRSGNCIVKRLKKKQEEHGVSNKTLLIAQVELKLISRVLNLSKLTRDQLLWCHEKLHKVNFRNRQVFVESSFLLFPC